jgi:hypothetical protein
MSEPKEEEQGEFKVVDRRLFTQDGERRPDVVVEPPKATPPSQEASRRVQSSAHPQAPQAPQAPKPPASAPPPREPQAKASPPSPDSSADKSAAHFEQLVMSLLTTAMFQMGLAARPGEQPPPPDFAAAQETIDLLTALQEKTKGNLTMAESDMLTGGLYELRMAFVELTRRMGRPVG